MIVVDVETSGLSPQKHSILSLGALDFLNPRDEFYQECRIRDGAEISPKALEINGFTIEEINDPSKQTVSDLLRHFIRWSEDKRDKTLAAENVQFDRDFIQYEVKRAGLIWPFGYRLIDLHSICYADIKSRGLEPPLENGVSAQSLSKTMEYVGLPPRHEVHNALEDARYEAEAFQRIIRGEVLLPEFEEYPIPQYLK